MIIINGFIWVFDGIKYINTELPVEVLGEDAIIIDNEAI